MNKELSDLAWACLPREFKEEVKEIYSNAITYHPCGYNHKTDLLKYLFGIHNLTSDAEGEEEMLCVSRKRVQGLYDLVYEIYADGTKEWYQGYMKAMQDLFGSKCLPDEKDCATCQDITCKNYDTVNGHCRFIEHCSYEPKPVEPKADKHFDNIISRDFDNHNRLHIAAMLAAGMLANDVRCYPVDRALELADKLIKKSKEDGKD